MMTLNFPTAMNNTMNANTTSVGAITNAEVSSTPNIRNIVTMTARQYLASVSAKELQGSAIYELFLHEMEQALFEEVLRYTGGNESKASRILGISRGTLRQRREIFGHYEDNYQEV